MNSTVLERLGEDIERLSLSEQVWLLERLAHLIREQTLRREDMQSSLEAMAADEDIQRELRAIEDEFSVADSDGLAYK